MTRIQRPKAAVLSSLMGVTGIVLLAGCSTTPAADTAVADDAATKAPKASTAPTTSEASGSESSASSKYADGTYTAEGSYSPQAGLIETIDVTLTLKDDVITDVQVAGNPKERESQEYQGKFIGGIADEVVGKSIDEINVSRVAGSSLTSTGFNTAVETIKSEAAS